MNYIVLGIICNYLLIGDLWVLKRYILTADSWFRYMRSLGVSEAKCWMGIIVGVAVHMTTWPYWVIKYVVSKERKGGSENA